MNFPLDSLSETIRRDWPAGFAEHQCPPPDNWLEKSLPPSGLVNSFRRA